MNMAPTATLPHLQVESPVLRSPAHSLPAEVGEVDVRNALDTNCHLDAVERLQVQIKHIGRAVGELEPVGAGALIQSDGPDPHWPRAHEQRQCATLVGRVGAHELPRTPLHSRWTYGPALLEHSEQHGPPVKPELDLLRCHDSPHHLGPSSSEVTSNARHHEVGCATRERWQI